MSCKELDRLRAELPGSSSSDWPREAQEHLQSCEQCSRLQRLVDLSSETAFPATLQSTIEAAILPGLKPVSPLPGALRVTVTLLLCSIAVIAAANWRLGVAGWRARSGLQALLDFSLLGISGLALADFVAHQMAPGSRRTVAVWLYLTTPVAALLVAATALFGDIWKPDFPRLALSCWEIGVTTAAVSAPLFWLALRRGFPLAPVSHGATAGLLAGLVGVTVLEIYCPYLDRLHISVAHIGAAVTCALAGAAAGGIVSKIRRRPRKFLPAGSRP